MIKKLISYFFKICCYYLSTSNDLIFFKVYINKSTLTRKMQQDIFITFIIILIFIDTILTFHLPNKKKKSRNSKGLRSGLRSLDDFTDTLGTQETPLNGA